MAKRTVVVAATGRVQAERPPAPEQTARQADGPRTLVGALTLPIEQLIPDPDQPRRDHGGDSLRALADSLTTYGVLQPLVVREQGTLDDGRTRYMVVAGGRRYAAALLAGLTRLPVVVKDTEGAALRMTQLVENLQRQDLAPLEEARAFKEIMDAEGLSAKALGQRLHLSGQHVRDRLLLLSDQPIADAVQRGQIGPTVARDVLHLADAAQAPLRRRISDGETLDNTDVKHARAAATAAGMTNPRAAGGGRAARTQTEKGVTHAEDKQTTFASSASPTPTNVAPVHAQAATNDLDDVVEGLNITRLTVALQYGIDKQWTCQDLLQAILEHQAADS